LYCLKLLSPKEFNIQQYEKVLFSQSKLLEFWITAAKQESGLILVTLDTGKVYAGQPYDWKVDEGITWGTMIMCASGVRLPETQEVSITTSYGIYAPAELPPGGEAEREWYENRKVVLPLDRVVSTHYFDPALFQEHGADQNLEHKSLS
jgi:hypothetical protein